MDQTHKWGIIGCGKIAHKFAQTLPASSGGQLWAVASRSENKARSFASKYEVPKHYGSYEGIVRDPDVEVIYIATPHPMHAENTILCLEAGKAVLCEKAFAMNSAQVKKMVELAEEKNLFLMEALWSRFIPHLLKVKELIDAGAIGKVKKVKADFGFAAKYDPQSRLFNPDLGGGALLDIGIYPLFLAYYLLGYPEEMVASAELSPTEVDQRGEVKLAYGGDSEAELEFTLLENTPVEANIIGTDGEIFIGSRWYMPNDFTLKKHGQEENYHFEYPSNGYHYEADEVMRCLERGQKESMLWSWSDSLQLMKIMDEIRRQCGIVYPKYDLA